MTKNIRQGATASFAIGDVVCPDATRTLEQVGPDLTIRGQITMLSDHGSDKSAFAVVQVQGIHSPLIVPVDRLQMETVSESIGEQSSSMATPKLANKQSA